MHPVIAEDLAAILDATDAALEKLADATVLVAGGAGFLPSYIVDTLAFANERLGSSACRIVCADNFRTGVANRLAHLEGRQDVSFVRCDITKDLPDMRPDFIVHAASIASPTWYRRFPLETIDINVIGTRRLLEFARDAEVRGFLYISSSEVYGDPPLDKIPTRENYWGNVSSLGPRACYDESKRLAETLCMTFFRSFDVPIVMVRPFNVYGPRLRLDDARVIPDLISDALDGRAMTLYGDGQVTRSFCYVADAAAAIIAVLGSDRHGEVYNVGNDEEVTIWRLAELVDDLSGNRRGVRSVASGDPDYLTDNPRRRCPDLTKIRDAIGWSPRVPLREGIERTLRYYRETPTTS
jgi:dTDP-glucose 4,6-dehydratase/UDP-glucuronate decarboxylase